jgi:hypothetical protein
VRSQLNRGRRLISAFVPALAWWRASRARMFHSWRHRSGLSNEAAILIPRFGGSNPPAAASLYASARHTHHISGEQSFTPTSAGFVREQPSIEAVPAHFRPRFNFCESIEKSSLLGVR